MAIDNEKLDEIQTNIKNARRLEYPSQEDVRSTFTVSQGNLVRCHSFHTRNRGNPLGSYKDRYPRVKLGKSKYHIHNLIWIYFRGDIPKDKLVDHIDGNIYNNDIDNLRLVSPRENTLNKKCHRNGKLQGTYFKRKKKEYGAQIQIGKEKVYLGRSTSEWECHEVYKLACKLCVYYENPLQYRELVWGVYRLMGGSDSGYR